MYYVMYYPKSNMIYTAEINDEYVAVDFGNIALYYSVDTDTLTLNIKFLEYTLPVCDVEGLPVTMRGSTVLLDSIEQLLQNSIILHEEGD